MALLEQTASFLKYARLCRHVQVEQVLILSLQLAWKVERHLYASICNVVAVTLSASCLVHGFELSDRTPSSFRKLHCGSSIREKGKWLT